MGIDIMFALFGIIIAFFVFLRPQFGFYLLLIIIPLENVVVIGGGVTWVRILGIIVFVSWLLNKLLNRESWSSIFLAKITIMAILFIGFVFLSSLWAKLPERPLSSTITFLQLFGLSLIIFDIVNSWKKLDYAIRFLIFGGLIASGMVIEQFFVQQVTRAGLNVSGGINQTSVVLIILIPLAFYLFRSTYSSPLWRTIAFFYILIAPIAVIVTFSRIGYVILPFVLVQQVFIGKVQGIRHFISMLILGSIIATAGVYFVPWETVEKRTETLAPLVENPEESIEGEVFITSRIHIWKTAYVIFTDHPIIGVGYRNFGFHFKNYQFVVAGLRTPGFKLQSECTQYDIRNTGRSRPCRDNPLAIIPRHSFSEFTIKHKE